MSFFSKHSSQVKRYIKFGAVGLIQEDLMYLSQDELEWHISNLSYAGIQLELVNLADFKRKLTWKLRRAKGERHSITRKVSLLFLRNPLRNDTPQNWPYKASSRPERNQEKDHQRNVSQRFRCFLYWAPPTAFFFKGRGERTDKPSRAQPIQFQSATYIDRRPIESASLTLSPTRYTEVRVSRRVYLTAKSNIICNHSCHNTANLCDINPA